LISNQENPNSRVFLQKAEFTGRIKAAHKAKLPGAG